MVIVTVLTIAVEFLSASNILAEDSLLFNLLGGMILILGVTSYTLLYKTAKKYNM